MAKYCEQCPSKAAGIPCENGVDSCVALDGSGSSDGAVLLRVRAGANSDLEQLRTELLEAADLLIDSILGEDQL
ncbi:MAG: hypothetical protein ABSD31_04215 [Candidatus Binataceae bacterium]|jgi:hypothetical protein